MPTNSSTAAAPSYARVLAESLIEAGCAGAWVAAGGMPAARRRLVRLAAVGGTVALTAGIARGAASPASDAPAGTEPTTGTEATRDTEPTKDTEPTTEAGEAGSVDAATPAPMPTARLAMAVAGALGVSVGVMLLGHRLEKRWLARLIRQGHPHPYRSLAVRIAALSLAGSVSTRLLEAHAVTRKAPAAAPVGRFR